MNYAFSTSPKAVHPANALNQAKDISLCRITLHSLFVFIMRSKHVKGGVQSVSCLVYLLIFSNYLPGTLKAFFCCIQFWGWSFCASIAFTEWGDCMPIRRVDFCMDDAIKWKLASGRGWKRLYWKHQAGPMKLVALMARVVLHLISLEAGMRRTVKVRVVTDFHIDSYFTWNVGCLWRDRFHLIADAGWSRY